MTDYLVLERVRIEGDERELWTPLAHVNAPSGDLANRAAARGDGTGGTRAGEYWAVPGRGVENNRTTVEVEHREVVSFHSPRNRRNAAPA